MIERLFGREFGPGFQPRYNIAPTQIAPVYTNEAGGSWRPLRWGLIPSWAKDPAIGNKTINARGEGIESKPSFRAAFKRRRCLVPADGFYEWKKKEPVRIHLKSGQPFVFAGLWEQWEHPQAYLETFTIITTTANELLQPIHHRMPVILPREKWEPWLDGKSGPSTLLEMLKPFPANELQLTLAHPAVNDARRDDPICLEPPPPPAQGTFF